MNDLKVSIINEGLKLVPYFLSIILYFTLFIPEGTVNWFTCLIRCLPVASLCLFVSLHGSENNESYIYSRRILFGLVFSVIGDAWLTNLKGFLVQGIICFAVAHLAYISAFDFQPLKPIIGAICFAVSLGTYSIVLMGVDKILTVATFLYMIIITTMVWRAIARVEFLEHRWTASKLCACLGAILFYISDCSLSIFMFKGPFRYAQQLIMVAYYGGQLAIALSVIDINLPTAKRSDNKKQQMNRVSRGVPTTKLLKRKPKI